MTFFKFAWLLDQVFHFPEDRITELDINIADLSLLFEATHSPYRVRLHCLKPPSSIQLLLIDYRSLITHTLNSSCEICKMLKWDELSASQLSEEKQVFFFALAVEPKMVFRRILLQSKLFPSIPPRLEQRK